MCRTRCGLLLPALVALAIFLTIPAASWAEKFPEPALVPMSWELQFEHKMPKRIVVEIPGERRPLAYWYMTYVVTNPTKDAVNYLPQMDMLTDEGKVIRSDRAIPKQVYDAIRKSEGNKLMETASQIEGPLQPGVDNSRDGVAVWPEPAYEMGTFAIFVGGLSGEYITLKRISDGWKTVDPANAGKELEGVAEKDRMVVRKTLHLVFQVPGDAIKPGVDPVLKKSEKWVMR